MKNEYRCRTCGELKPPHDFYYKGERYNKKGELRTYYNLSKCKKCVQDFSIYKKSEIDYDNVFTYQEGYDFMKYISRVRGYLDIIDLYKLIDHHIRTFGYKEVNLEINDDIEKMYKELYNAYKHYDENKLNK